LYDNELRASSRELREKAVVIPAVIVLALVAGLFRVHWVAAPIVAVAWVALLMIAGDPGVPRSELAIGGGIFSLLNAGPGYGLGRGIRTMVTTVTRDVSEQLDAAREQESGSSGLEARSSESE
jgi:hypothetical protein